MKDGADANDLLERLGARQDVRRASSRTCEGAIDPKRFVGRAPEQVDEFLARRHHAALCRRHRAGRSGAEELRV